MRVRSSPQTGALCTYIGEKATRKSVRSTRDWRRFAPLTAEAAVSTELWRCWRTAGSWRAFGALRNDKAYFENQVRQMRCWVSREENITGSW
jgi:hypothetical protein